MLPICDETTSHEEPCRDEGDLDDCEEGFVDKGFGCVPIEGESEPPICTPDGPECPPCPEGVEAGWCADEDERQDFDCDDPGMENDPRCKDREPVDETEDPEIIVEELPEEEEENSNEEETPTVVPPPEEEEEEEPEEKELEEEEEESEEETEEVSTEEE
jgi:hypothetical protein